MTTIARIYGWMSPFAWRRAVTQRGYWSYVEIHPRMFLCHQKCIRLTAVMIWFATHWTPLSQHSVGPIRQRDDSLEAKDENPWSIQGGLISSLIRTPRTFTNSCLIRAHATWQKCNSGYFWLWAMISFLLGMMLRNRVVTYWYPPDTNQTTPP